MARTDYCGAILAAGRGARMQPFSEQYPKPLLPVCNRSIIEHQIGIMKAIGIAEIFVVIGHKGYEIAKTLGDGSRYGVTLHYIEQTAPLGIAHAVGRLGTEVARPFLLMLGDIFFVADRLERMFHLFEEQGGGAVLAAKDEADEEAVKRNFSIELAADGRAVRVVEKPRQVRSRLKGVGIYLFDVSVFDAIRRTPRTALRDEYELTDSVQAMIDAGEPVRPAVVVHEEYNLSNPGDLLRCNLEQARREVSGAVVGPNCTLHPDAVVMNSVLGANVTIEHPIAVANSLIFDDTRIRQRGPLNHVIVTPKVHVECARFLGDGDPIRIVAGSG